MSKLLKSEPTHPISVESNDPSEPKPTRKGQIITLAVSAGLSAIGIILSGPLEISAGATTALVLGATIVAGLVRSFYRVRGKNYIKPEGTVQAATPAELNKGLRGTAIWGVITFIIILASLSAINWVADSNFEEYRAKDWEPISATMLETSPSEIEYRYEVDGRRYTTTESIQSSRRFSDYEEGDEFEVYYNPANPAEATAEYGYRWQFWLWVGGIACLLLYLPVRGTIYYLLNSWIMPYYIVYKMNKSRANSAAD